MSSNLDCVTMRSARAFSNSSCNSRTLVETTFSCSPSLLAAPVNCRPTATAYDCNVSSDFSSLILRSSICLVSHSPVRSVVFQRSSKFFSINSSTRVLAKSAASRGSAESAVISMMRVVLEPLTLMSSPAMRIARSRSMAGLDDRWNTLRHAASLSLEVPYGVFLSLRSRSVTFSISDRLCNTLTCVMIS